MSYNAVPVGILDIQKLRENLDGGQLSLSSAINHISLIIGQALQLVEKYAEDRLKYAKDQSSKVEMMDKLINDLSEKCQGMQQALLYKEEKYDEKCREVERYKVICELSTKAAVGDNPYYMNQNQTDDQECPDRKCIVKLETQDHDSIYDNRSVTRKSTKGHVKLNHNNNVEHLNDFQYPSAHSRAPTPMPNPIERTSQINLVSTLDKRDSFAIQYAGGPSRRMNTPSQISIPKRDSQLKDRLELIGGINVRGPRMDQELVYRSPTIDQSSDDRTKRTRISMPGQSNEVLSSISDNAYQMKQKVSDGDYHRQVSGIWTKMSGRRKKEWPF